MITFVCGEVDEKNATVTLGGDTHDGFFKRDSEGHIEVTVDIVEPDHGTPVDLVLHAENDGSYRGTVDASDGTLTFRRA